MRYSFGGVVLVTIGVLMLLDNLDVLEFGEVVGTYWPLILIVWGFFILRRRKPNRTQHQDFVVEDVHKSVSQDLIHDSNVFGDLFVQISSQNFKGGSLSTTFGDCDIDLRKATVAEGEHILRAHTVFGTCRIILPPNAPVAVSATCMVGDLRVFDQKKDGFSCAIDMASPDFANSLSRIKIVANTVFGEVIVL